MSDERRRYAKLNAPEQAVVEYALERNGFDRSEVMDAYSEEYSDQQLADAFTSLRRENRLFRRGNESRYVMIERDLF